MAKTDTIKAKSRSDLKKEVEITFEKLGLSADGAIRLFYYQVKLWKGLPAMSEFPIRQHLRLFRDTDAGNNLIHCGDADNTFNKLGI